MEDPRHALAAPSHPDPYGWYARLRVARPVFFDAAIGLWVVCGPYLVEQALQHPALRVRPPGEPVPKPLQGRTTGAVFELLVRMNDGDFHARHRPAVASATARMSEAAVAQATEAAVRDLHARLAPDALLSAIPVQAMARLLGVASQRLDATVAQVHDFTAGIAAGADGEAIARADAAALALMAQGVAEGLAPARAANRIALMQQALDATAGLIGNAIALTQREAGAWDAADVVARTLRSDPPIHNTRRYAAQALELGGQPVAPGDGLLLILVPGAGARGFVFGAGAHACPGEGLALQVATTALASLRALGALQRFPAVRAWRPLPNARIPVFGG